MGSYNSGSDAASMKPKLIPDAELLPRDDSGGPDWDPYTQQWGDGGYVTGAKAHLSVNGGPDDSLEADEISSEPRESGGKYKGQKNASPKAPAKSARLAKE